MSSIVGVGVDLVDVGRLAAAIRRRPSLEARVFTTDERASARGVNRDERLAARFAAKEATMKSLGASLFSFPLRDVEVVTAASGRPSLALHGAAATRARGLGVDRLHVSLTHAAGLATAVVVAEAGA